MSASQYKTQPAKIADSFEERCNRRESAPKRSHVLCVRTHTVLFSCKDYCRNIAISPGMKDEELPLRSRGLDERSKWSARFDQYFQAHKAHFWFFRLQQCRQFCGCKSSKINRQEFLGVTERELAQIGSESRTKRSSQLHDHLADIASMKHVEEGLRSILYSFDDGLLHLQFSL